MRESESDFPFNGERDYVHGPTLFEIFRTMILDETGGNDDSAFRFSYFRVNQPILANGLIRIFGSDETETRKAVGPAMAELACRAADQDFYAAFYDENRHPIKHRRESLEKTFINEITLCDPLNGTARLGGIASNNDLFQAVVEANKQIHMETVTGDRWSNDVKFRFAYCLNYTCPPTGHLKNLGEVNVRFLGSQEAGGNFFSLTELDLTIGGFASTFKLCFASRDLIGYTPER
jgi:hypothetical protein